MVLYRLIFVSPSVRQQNHNLFCLPTERSSTRVGYINQNCPTSFVYQRVALALVTKGNCNILQ